MNSDYYAVLWYRAELGCGSAVLFLSGMFVGCVILAVMNYAVYMGAAYMGAAMVIISLDGVALLARIFCKSTRLHVDELLAAEEKQKQLSSDSE